MTITFLGTGTSQGVPVIACDCEVCTSSNLKDKRLRSSILVEIEGKVMVIDAGPDFRYQMLRAGVKHLDAILLTHEHKDHIAGLDDVRAFNYRQEMAIDVFATERVQQALKQEFSYIFSDYQYPGIPKIHLKTIYDVPFDVAGISVAPVEVMHYRLPVLGFRIGDFTYITDAKTVSEKEKDKIRGTKVLVINALQQASHISHFTLEEALAFAEVIQPEITYLTHISHRLGLHDEIAAMLPPKVKLAYDGYEINID